jgi:hypothetical protein
LALQAQQQTLLQRRLVQMEETLAELCQEAHRIRSTRAK